MFLDLEDINLSETTKVSSGGISAASLLGILFIALKLTGHITWPWVWVLSPFWIPFAIFLGLLLIIFLCVIVAGALDK